ncbi:MAG: VWA domain-containing protein [Cyanobacteria bacterium REEB67]|nr:VWA domain-containing protein [Cyanobacteria bacterium REEB67]
MSEEQRSEDKLKRWRLVLGDQDNNGVSVKLSGDDAAMDIALSSLYNRKETDGSGKERTKSGDLSSSSPKVARWLGDIRKYFPSSVVTIMQKDALEKLDLKRMLLEPELLSSMVPDVGLVATLAALGSALPNKSKETARQVVRKVCDDLMQRLGNPTRQAVTGALNKARRNNNPRHSEIDWDKTIRVNLRHYQSKYKTIIPQRRIGYGKRSASLKDIILLVDQSGSMATSVVYASIFAAVLATVRSATTRMVAFDTSVVDLSDKLSDPVDIIFGVQLGGGTDINRAVEYGQTLVRQPADTIFVIISDLFEGGNNNDMLKRVYSLVNSGVKVICLLALSDDGAPAFDHRNAAYFAEIGIPTFACTPDQFPQMMAQAISQGDILQWAAGQGIVTTK